MKVDQLKKYIIEPVLKKLNLHSESAVNLLLGTCAQESALGKYIQQLNGVAHGIYQMEPATYHDIFENYLRYNPLVKDQILYHCGYAVKPEPERLIDDLRLSTAMARIHYLRVPKALPEPNDILGLAQYWKKYYNTSKGKGSVADFVNNYEAYVRKK